MSETPNRQDPPHEQDETNCACNRIKGIVCMMHFDIDSHLLKTAIEVSIRNTEPPKNPTD